jgi:hypothetical protein
MNFDRKSKAITRLLTVCSDVAIVPESLAEDEPVGVLPPGATWLSDWVATLKDESSTTSKLCIGMMVPSGNFNSVVRLHEYRN